MKALRELHAEVSRQWAKVPALYRLPLVPIIAPLLELLNGILDRLEMTDGKEKSG